MALLSPTGRRNLSFVRAALTGRGLLYTQLAVTTRCNLGCAMCRSTASRRAEGELSAAELARLARVLRAMGVDALVLSGGEPLLRSDLEEVVRALAGAGLSVRMQTNGLLLDPDRAAALRRAGLEAVTISLHGLDPTTHEAVSGRPGSWEAALCGLAAAAEAFDAPGALNGVNVVVCAPNLDQVPGIVRLATRLGFFASLIPVHEHAGPADRFVVRGLLSGLGFAPADEPRLRAVYAEVARLKRAGADVYNSHRFLRESAAFLATGRIAWRCASPDLYISVSADGRLLPCVDLPDGPAMLADGFLATWRDPAFRAGIRTRVAACRGCMYACYPELVWATRDPRTFLERVAFARAVAGRRSHPLSFEALRAAAREEASR